MKILAARSRHEKNEVLSIIGGLGDALEDLENNAISKDPLWKMVLHLKHRATEYISKKDYNFLGDEKKY